MSLKEELKKSKQIQRKISEVVSKTRGTGVQFVLQELAMGIAFAKLSDDSRLSGNTENANRQKARAREAHETVRRFLPEATPNPEQKKKIEAGLAELDAKLNALGMPASKRARSGKSASKNIQLSITWNSEEASLAPRKVSAPRTWRSVRSFVKQPSQDIKLPSN